MTGKLEQINVAYDAGEDRLLLKIRNSDREEYRLWLTRRYTGLLWKVCNKIVRELGWSGMLQDEGSRASLLAEEREQALQGADFATPYRECADSFPLGEDGTLGYKISFKRTSEDQVVLNLTPSENSGIALVMDSKLLHTLCKLIAEAARAADWQLDLSVPDPEKRRRRLN